MSVAETVEHKHKNALEPAPLLVDGVAGAVGRT
jgi:hypothetical protein